MDFDFISFYEEFLAKSKPTHEVPFEEFRANPSKYAVVWSYDSKDEPCIQNYEIESKDGALVPVRLYYPDPAKFGPGPYSVHINFHEAILGKNIEDAWVSLSWVRDSSEKLNIIKSSISLGGISAGGYLSSVAPVTDCCSYKNLEDSPYESFREYSRAPLLNWASISHFRQYAFPDDKADHVRSLWPEWWLSPIKAPNFANFCDTFLITPEIDPVRNKGEHCGKKLVSAGNKVTFKRYLGVPHPFMYMTDYLQKARDYDEDIILALKVAHGL